MEASELIASKHVHYIQIWIIDHRIKPLSSNAWLMTVLTDLRRKPKT